jgi:hypothetical protein
MEENPSYDANSHLASQGIPSFSEPKEPLPCSQEPATSTHPEQNECSHFYLVVVFISIKSSNLMDLCGDASDMHFGWTDFDSQLCPLCPFLYSFHENPGRSF